MFLNKVSTDLRLLALKLVKFPLFKVTIIFSGDEAKLRSAKTVTILYRLCMLKGDCHFTVLNETEARLPSGNRQLGGGDEKGTQLASKIPRCLRVIEAAVRFGLKRQVVPASQPGSSSTVSRLHPTKLPPTRAALLAPF